MTYTPITAYIRTSAERADPFLSWKRSDEAFFASGACHILAHLYWQMHQAEGWRRMFIQPTGDRPGSHVYATNGEWVFDYNGYTPEREYLDKYRASWLERDPEWDCTVTEITMGLEEFCAQNYHRPPSHYAYLPWERAYAFINKFPDTPPKLSFSV